MYFITLPLIYQKNYRIDLPERVDQLIHEDTMVIDLVSKGDIWTSSEKYININMKNKK